MADDDAYQRALRRRGEILDQLQALQNELKDVDGFVTLYGRLFQHGPVPASATGGDERTQTSGRRQRNILPPARLADLCREILAHRGHPMTRTELLDAIQEQGIPLAGSDPSKNLGTILWRRDDLFINLPGRGYWLRGQPVPD